MRICAPLVACLLALLPVNQPLGAQESATVDEDFRVYNDHPRLLLPARRLKLLQREKERESLRWRQFETLIAGKANMPEPGFAFALYYQITGDKQVGRAAVEWALAPRPDTRQLALVYDWCHDLLTPAEEKTLAGRLTSAIGASVPGVVGARDRAFAAIALGDIARDASERTLADLVKTWWRRETVAAIKKGEEPVARRDIYALTEFLHAIRDNLTIDLRDNAGAFFKELPIFMLLSYYPASYPAAENEYRIPIYPGKGEPDLNQAALSRAAELALVSYDNNAIESQFLQGWLIQDRFLMRGTFGNPYEILWANPYQPGLSYYHLPNLFHDKHYRGGKLLMRSTWDDDAVWFGLVNGAAQTFENGKIGAPGKSLRVGDVQVLFPGVQSGSTYKFDVRPDSGKQFFLVGLAPRKAYDVEADDREIFEVHADAGGIVELSFPEGTRAGVRLRESPSR